MKKLFKRLVEIWKKFVKQTKQRKEDTKEYREAYNDITKGLKYGLFIIIEFMIFSLLLTVARLDLVIDSKLPEGIALLLMLISYLLYAYVFEGIERQMNLKGFSLNSKLKDKRLTEEE